VLTASILALTMEAVSTSDTSVSFEGTTRRTIPEGCHLHTRSHEHLTSNQDTVVFVVQTCLLCCSDRVACVDCGHGLVTTDRQTSCWRHDKCQTPSKQYSNWPWSQIFCADMAVCMSVRVHEVDRHEVGRPAKDQSDWHAHCSWRHGPFVIWMWFQFSDLSERVERMLETNACSVWFESFTRIDQW
jgi:hypothetical protein